MKTICIQQVFTFFMALNSTLGTFKSLTSQSPKKAFTFITISWGSSRPKNEVMRSRWGYWIDESLKCFFIHMQFLKNNKTIKICYSSLLIWKEFSCNYLNIKSISKSDLQVLHHLSSSLAWQMPALCLCVFAEWSIIGCNVFHGAASVWWWPYWYNRIER